MEPDTFSNTNFQNLSPRKKYSVLKIFITIIVVALIVIGALFFKKLSNEKRDAKLLKDIRQSATDQLLKSEDDSPFDREGASSAIKSLLKDSGDRNEDTPLSKEELDIRSQSLKSLLAE